MSEEERKAMKVIKHRTGLLKSELEIENQYKDDEPRIFYLIQQIQSNEVIVELIEKQQKEIVELKESIKHMYYDEAIYNLLEDKLDMTREEVKELLAESED